MREGRDEMTVLQIPATCQYKSLRPAVLRAFCMRARSWNCFLERRRTCCNDRDKESLRQAENEQRCIRSVRPRLVITFVVNLFMLGNSNRSTLLEKHQARGAREATGFKSLRYITARVKAQTTH